MTMSCRGGRAILTVLLLAHASAGVAQEVIARDVWPSARILSRRDADSLERAARLTPEQVDAARTLLRGGRTRLEGAIRKLSRRIQAIREGLDFEDEKSRTAMAAEDAAAMAEYQKESEAIERECMNDLRSLLSDSQSEGWAVFERSRRRLILSSAPFNADLSEIVRTLVLTDDEQAAAAPVVERYERELDSIVGEWRAHIRAADLIAGSRESEDPDAERRSREIVRRLALMQQQSARLLAAAIPAKGDQVIRAFHLAAFSNQLSPSVESTRIQGLLAVRGLSATQRDRILALARKTDEELAASMRDQFQQGIDRWLAPGETGSRPDLDWKPVASAANRAHRRLFEQALAVLTEEQRRGYVDGSDPAGETPDWIDPADPRARE